MTTQRVLPFSNAKTSFRQSFLKKIYTFSFATSIHPSYTNQPQAHPIPSPQQSACSSPDTGLDFAGLIMG